jgi:tRNA-dihydrouridine synthase B
MNAKVYLAPMAGVTDLAFRLVSRRFGASLCFYEMLDAKAMLHDHPKNWRLLKTLKDDRPIAAQLVGADPSAMLDAALKLTELTDISFLDINSACPAKKIVKKGAGASLLQDTARLGRIVKALASRLSIPVSVKLRTGLYERDVRQVARAAEICQANGASTVFIHGRTASQGYFGDVDYESIRAAKDALGIPVFGSGNVFDVFSAGEMLGKTGCDGILVARGALGNPWIFAQIEDYLKKGTVSTDPPDLPAKKKVLKEHLAWIEKYKDISRNNKIGFMGKVTMWYLKGVYNAKRIREEICRVRSYGELIDLIGRV